MTIFYLDPANGSDANNGSSWALAWKTITSGATAARLTAGDTIRIAKSPDPVSIGNASWTGVSRVAGNDINFSSCASTNTSPIQITRAAHGLVTGDLVFISGYNTNYPANGLWKVTYTGINTFTLDGSVGLANETNGAIEKCNYRTVVLAAPQTAKVTTCDGYWTAANGSTVNGNLLKQGNISAQIAKTSPANSTLYAYQAMTLTDFSAYQKLSFWLSNSTAILTDQWYLCLCSDAAGAVVVDTIKIPSTASTGNAMPLTLSRVGGGNLGSSIQSIALYSGTSAGTTAGIVFDNIIACTTDGLNLQSLISKNSAAQGGTECWYGIQSIDGVYVMLDMGHAQTPAYSTSQRGYYGTTENVATYKRETFKTAIATSDSVGVSIIQKSGSAGNLIAYEGGYNTTTTIQDGETLLDGLNGFGYGIDFTNVSLMTYSSLNWIGVCRYNIGIRMYNGNGYNTLINVRASNNGGDGIYFNNSAYNNLTGTAWLNNNAGAGINGYTSSNMTLGTLTCNNNTGNGLYTGGTTWTATAVTACNNAGGGMSINDTACVFGTVTANYNISYGVYFYGSGTLGCTITTIAAANYNTSYGVYFGSNANNNNIGTITQASYNGSYGVYFSGNSSNFIGAITAANNNGSYGLAIANTSWFNRINSLSTSGNTTGGISISFTGINYLRNALLAEGTPVSGSLATAYSKLYCYKYQQIANSHKVFVSGASFISTYALNKRHTAIGIAWQVTPTSTRPITVPFSETLAEIAVVANKLVTVSCWILKDDANNVGASIFCRGNQLAGVPNNIEAVSAASTVYNQVTLTFTPTEAGVITIEMRAWYVAATNCVAYFDDLSVSQAT